MMKGSCSRITLRFYKKLPDNRSAKGQASPLGIYSRIQRVYCVYIYDLRGRSTEKGKTSKIFAMSEFQIKFYSTDYLYIEKEEYKTLFMSQPFKTYRIHWDPNTLLIMDEMKKKMATTQSDKLHYQFDKENKTVRFFAKNENEETQLIMEIKGKNDRYLKKLTNAGPLSYSPCRQIRSSIFSSENPTQNFRGFLNLCFIVLFATNFRLVVENFLKYGILINRIDPLGFFSNPRNFPCLSATFSLFFILLIAFSIEKKAFARRISDKTSVVLHTINIVLCLLYPFVFVRISNPLPIPAIIFLFISVVMTLKLISYSDVMRISRNILIKIEEHEAKSQDPALFIDECDISSDNLAFLKKNRNRVENFVNMQSLLYFIAAPTLCFQLVYPRTTRIRKIWLLKRISELLLLLALMAFIIGQYIVPIVENALPHLHNMSWSYLLERLLKLSIPNLYIWIGMFFSLFHLWFNITGELLRFGDRQFYLDWWNSKSFEEYWKLWNLPVRNWFIRHIYNPLLKKGYSKTFATILVFFISALGHEYLISASLGVWSFWAFIAMILQAPLIVLEKFLGKNSQLGNVNFWISFCFLGQPMCVLIYYYQYIQKYGADGAEQLLQMK